MILPFQRRPRRRCVAGKWLATLAIIGTAAFPWQSAQAQVTVSGEFIEQTPSGSGFVFDFDVFNNTANTLALVDVTIPGGVTPTNLMAPVGFQIVFDPGLGLLSFLEDSDPVTPQSFAPGSTITGFTFQTPTQIGPSSFSALDVEGNLFSGTTTLTASSTAAPEPGVLPLLGVAAAGQLAFTLRLRRRGARKVTHV